MEPKNKLLAIVFIILLMGMGFTRCAGNNIKPAPEYKGVDSRVQPLVKEYKELAKLHGLVFDKEVTVGFKNINDGTIVGICTYGDGWREIDIDKSFWSSSTKTSHTALLFHELTHCYCGRNHDYNGVDYPDSAMERTRRILDWIKNDTKIPGFYDDGCPKSFMYPEILDDTCTLLHYNDYINEMFQNCSPY